MCLLYLLSSSFKKDKNIEETDEPRARPANGEKAQRNASPTSRVPGQHGNGQPMQQTVGPDGGYKNGGN